MSMTDNALDALIQQLGTPEAVAQAARRRKIQATYDHFTSGVTGMTLTIGDWKDLKLFLNEPNTGTHNAQSIYEDVLADVDRAIKDKDADALLKNLLMMYKAVRRV